MATDYDAGTLQRLLDLQTEDLEIMRLGERRAGLPEAERLKALTGQLAELDDDLAIARKQLAEIERAQDRLEGEIEILGQKLAREEGRLFSGSVSNPKELSALQAEVGMLKRRGSEMEDSLLEVMVQKDQATETVTALESERAAAAADAEQSQQKVTELYAELDGKLAEHGSARTDIADEIPAALLAQYDSIRAAKHGVGAAALSGGTCQGCHTALPAREVERLKAERGLQRCDNCRRILVVT